MKQIASGELIVVGTGIGLAGNMTASTESIIIQAEKLLYVVADVATAAHLEQLNSTAESIYSLYDESLDRIDTYYKMTECILDHVRAGLKTCAAFYGHPGIFVFPAHEAVLKARTEGYRAEMKAAVSAEDCLFADLGIDPGRVGCQSFEATDFLVYDRIFDPNSLLVLWQVGVIGQIGFRRQFPIGQNIEVLKEALRAHYPADHYVIVYEASVLPVCDPVIRPFRLDKLDPSALSPISTLVVPPLSSRRGPNIDMVRRLDIPERYILKRAEDPSLYDPAKPGALVNWPATV
ncbi:SAM-dependent methyltransferase [Mesorhizobium sp. NZP2077]|uniref:SAM-dependent methyltransferase n=1 Tax=Mesorhizobium sp. NZP2077 TaxID=2483404 RepID=UPI001AEDE2F7|nr:SAM-dependent methyltransferase [Mesorhizobium sp. NZP2077]